MHYRTESFVRATFTFNSVNHYANLSSDRRYNWSFQWTIQFCSFTIFWPVGASTQKTILILILWIDHGVFDWNCKNALSQDINENFYKSSIDPWVWTMFNKVILLKCWYTFRRHPGCLLLIIHIFLEVVWQLNSRHWPLHSNWDYVRKLSEEDLMIKFAINVTLSLMNWMLG